MATDAALRLSLVSLAAVVVLIGICTLSFKKMVITYVFGLFGIAGILLPDWEFFDRDIREWFSPMPPNRSEGSSPPNSTAAGLRLYPGRLILYSIIYSIGFYKWWNFVTS